MATINRNEAQLAMELLTKSIFGTFYIEEHKWIFPNNDRKIGRTYFADRSKRPIPFDDVAIENIKYIYHLLFNGKTSYNMEYCIDRFITLCNEYLNTDFSFLFLQTDDTAELRKHKITALNIFLDLILSCLRNHETFDRERYAKNSGETIKNMKNHIRSVCTGTYTEYLLEKEPSPLSFDMQLLTEDKNVIYTSLFARGKILFFFKSSLSSVEELLNELFYVVSEEQYIFSTEWTTDPDYADSLWNFHPPVRYMKPEKYMELKENGELFPLKGYYDEDSALWITKIQSCLEHGQHVFILGSLEEYINLPFAKEDILPFLVLTDNPESLRKLARRRGSTPLGALVRLKGIYDIITSGKVEGLSLLPLSQSFTNKELRNTFDIIEATILSSRFRSSKINPYSSAFLQELKKIRFNDELKNAEALLQTLRNEKEEENRQTET